jgi:hypothetical protein
MDSIFGGGKKKKTSIKSEKAGQGKGKGSDKKGGKGDKDKKGSGKNNRQKELSNKEKKQGEQKDKKQKKLQKLTHLDNPKAKKDGKDASNKKKQKDQQASFKADKRENKEPKEEPQGWWDAGPAGGDSFDIPDYDDDGLGGESSMDSMKVASESSGSIGSIGRADGAGSISSISSISMGSSEQGAGKKRKRKRKQGQGAGAQPTPTAISEVTASFPEENDYLAAFHEVESKFPPDMHRIFDHKLPDNRRSALFDAVDLDVAEKYAWAIPNKRALRIIAAFAPIVEIGCGKGYWGSLLLAAGIDYVGYDLHADDPEEQNHFCDVKTGGPDDLKQNQDRTLMLCYPDDFEDSQESLALRCLECFKGDTIIVIGESFGNTFQDNPWVQHSAQQYTTVQCKCKTTRHYTTLQDCAT